MIPSLPGGDNFVRYVMSRDDNRSNNLRNNESRYNRGKSGIDFFLMMICVGLFGPVTVSAFALFAPLVSNIAAIALAFLASFVVLGAFFITVSSLFDKKPSVSQNHRAESRGRGQSAGIQMPSQEQAAPDRSASKSHNPIIAGHSEREDSSINNAAANQLKTMFSNMQSFAQFLQYSAQDGSRKNIDVVREFVEVAQKSNDGFVGFSGKVDCFNERGDVVNIALSFNNNEITVKYKTDESSKSKAATRTLDDIARCCKVSESWTTKSSASESERQVSCFLTN